jgi:competence ComEA-like helix-hairpin-helix protein
MNGEFKRGEFKRGEIWWFSSGYRIGSEMREGRPAVIISDDAGNESSPVVNCAMLTTRPKEQSIYPKTENSGRPSWIVTNQIYTYDKQRALEYIGKLSESEQTELDRCLCQVLGLQPMAEAVEAEDDDEFVPEYDDRVEELEERVTELTHAGKVWEKLYAKALDEIAELKYGRDKDARAPVVKANRKDNILENITEKVAKKVEEKIDVNTCSVEALVDIGCSKTVAEDIVLMRPYKSLDELMVLDSMSGEMWASIYDMLCCISVEPKKEKVNVNTASAKEISDKSGLSLNVAYGVTGYRKTNGSYKSLEDLLKAPRFTKHHLEKHRDMLEV